MENRFNEAKSFLTWRYETKEERERCWEKAVRVSSTVDPGEFINCRSIGDERFKTGLEHLIRRLETEEVRKEKTEFYTSVETDPVEFCSNLIMELDFQTADQYLKWRFKIEEERRNVKAIFYKSEEDIRDKFLKIWCSMDPHRDGFFRNYVCRALLTFCLESKEAVNDFRRYNLVEEKSFLKAFANYVSFYSAFDICYDFLTFCFLSPKEIKEIKNDLGKLISKAENETWWD